VPEVLEAVNRLNRSRRRARIYWALALCIVVFGAALSGCAGPGSNSTPPPAPITFPNAAPIKIVSSLANSGWMLNFDILAQNPIKEIFVRGAGEETFKAPGFTDFRDPRTDRPRLTWRFRSLETSARCSSNTPIQRAEYGPYALVVDHS
jgi:hypothetical protein